MFAPLVLWAPDEVAYLNGVLVGGLLIALTSPMLRAAVSVRMIQPGRAEPSRAEPSRD